MRTMRAADTALYWLCDDVVAGLYGEETAMKDLAVALIPYQWLYPGSGYKRWEEERKGMEN